MKDGFLRLYGWYRTLLFGMAVTAGAATFVIMWLVDASALSRKLFNAPVIGSVEITQSLMTVSVMLAMGYAQMRHSHLRVVILTGRLPRPLAKGLYVGSLVIGFLFFMAVTVATFWFALRSYRIDEHVWGATVRFPVYPAKAIISLGSLLLALQFLLDAVRVGVFGLIEAADEVTPPEQGIGANG